MSRFVPRPQGMVELNAPGGIVDRAVAKAAGAMRDDAKRIITAEGRVDTGAMRQGIKTERIAWSTGGVSYRVSGSTDHDIYQHEGVAPFGPRRARVLRFKPKGSSVHIFRPRVRGFAGIHFLSRARDQLSIRDFT